MTRPAADTRETSRAGRRVALWVAAIGLLWIAATWAGEALDWSQRLRALFDLAALAGFGWCLWAVYGIWRQRRNN